MEEKQRKLENRKIVATVKLWMIIRMGANPDANYENLNHDDDDDDDDGVDFELQRLQNVYILLSKNM